MITKSKFVWLTSLALSIVLVAAACGDETTPIPTAVAATETGIKVPSGFEVVKYFGGLDHPTSMAIGPDGKLYVTLQSGDVISLTDEDSDGVADRQTVLISGLFLPLGITFVGDEAYVSARGEVVKVVDADRDGISESVEYILSGLPVGGELHTNVQNGAITLGPDGFLHVSIGIDVESQRSQPIPIDPTRESHMSIGGTPPGEAQGTGLGLNTGLVGPFVANELAGTIIRFRPDGSDLQIFAVGFDNPLGLAFDDQGNLFATDIGPDDPEGPDELNYIVQGADYGAPKEFGARNLPGDIPAVAELEVAGTNGLSIYMADQFPEEYKGNAFIAQWGQAIGDVPNGNRIIRVIMTKVVDRFDGVVRTFAVGFQHPISTVVAPDGSLFVADWGSFDFSDTESGAIYRISVKQ